MRLLFLCITRTAHLCHSLCTCNFLGYILIAQICSFLLHNVPMFDKHVFAATMIHILCLCHTLHTQIYLCTPLCTLSQFPIWLLATNSTNHHHAYFALSSLCLHAFNFRSVSFESTFSWNFAPIHVFSDINKAMFIVQQQKIALWKIDPGKPFCCHHFDAWFQWLKVNFALWNQQNMQLHTKWKWRYTQYTIGLHTNSPPLPCK